jgi:MerR family transcriptional regulator, thiopeptide resistance regulator
MDLSPRTGWSVGRLADEAGVTVRTLHHYDSVGLLSPSARSDAGYRVYDADDAARLQQIVAYRALGFALDDIAGLLDEEVDAVEQLRIRRAAVLDEITRLHGVLTALDDTLSGRVKEEMMADFERLPSETQESLLRTRDQFRHTDEWKADERLHATRTRAEQAEGADARAAWAAVLRAAVEDGVDPGSERGMAIAEESRQSATKYGGYDCTYEIHVGITRNYLDEPQGMWSIMVRPDEHVPGMAEFLHAAAVANGQRAQATAD